MFLLEEKILFTFFMIGEVVPAPKFLPTILKTPCNTVSGYILTTYLLACYFATL